MGQVKVPNPENFSWDDALNRQFTPLPGQTGIGGAMDVSRPEDIEQLRKEKRLFQKYLISQRSE